MIIITSVYVDLITTITFCICDDQVSIISINADLFA